MTLPDPLETSHLLVVLAHYDEEAQIAYRLDPLSGDYWMDAHEDADHEDLSRICDQIESYGYELVDESEWADLYDPDLVLEEGWSRVYCRPIEPLDGHKPLRRWVS